MAAHEFGIMEKTPIKGERYDAYEPQKYGCISVSDKYIESILSYLEDIEFYWHTIDIKGNNLAYCGITLISPDMCGKFIEVIKDRDEFSELQLMLTKAMDDNKFVIHFGI